MRKQMLIALLAATAVAGCNAGSQPDENRTVETSGKKETALADVPAPVLAAARAAQPTMTISEASAEVRDGRNYFDLEGTLPDGAEIELDMMEEEGVWRVVETQRDIAFGTVPGPVRTAFAGADSGFTPVRVIESRQADGLIIYELFGPAQGDADGTKVEVKYDGQAAELLTEEWAH